MGDIILVYREAEISLNNLENLIKTPLEEEPDDAVDIPGVNEIQFENVSFKHKSSKNYAVQKHRFQGA